MTLQDLKQTLALILSLEEGVDVDWARVRALSLELEEDLRRGAPATYPADFVDEFLSGFDRRRQDPSFAQQQRARLVSFLRS